MLSVLLVVLPVHAGERDGSGGQDYSGPLRVRDLTPFGFLRLDMRPSSAAIAPAGSASIEFDLGYQNIWTLSRDVRQYLNARPRGPLTAADIAQIRAMPGEQFLVDGEIAQLEVAGNYAVSARLTVYAVLAAVSYTGGFLDGLVEEFHRDFGFGNVGRSGLTRKQANVFFDLKGVQMAEIDRSDANGLLDPVLGLRSALIANSSGLNVAAEAAVKVPVSGDARFSTGRLDLGTQLTVQWLDHGYAYYASGALVYYGGSPGPLRNQKMMVPTAILGYAYRWNENTDLIAQLYASRSTFTADETDVSELRGIKSLLSLGVRHRTARGYWSFAFTENLRNNDYAPDVGFQFSAGHRFGD